MDEDDELNKAYFLVDFRTKIKYEREQLELRKENLLNYSYKGGLFKITQDLISFVETLITRGHREVVLIDSYNVPIEIDDLENFQQNIISHYFEVVNIYYKEYNEIDEQRLRKDSLKW